MPQQMAASSAEGDKLEGLLGVRGATCWPTGGRSQTWCRSHSRRPPSPH